MNKRSAYLVDELKVAYSKQLIQKGAAAFTIDLTQENDEYVLDLGEDYVLQEN